MSADRWIASGGKNIYGVSLGILLLESRFPRIPGDVGNAETWPFPAQFRVVSGATPSGVVRNLSPETHYQPFLDAALELQAAGVDLITTGCGFLVLLQDRLQSALSVPFLSSSLLQVPWIASTLPPGQAVGILTIERSSLRPEHLEAARISERDKVVVAGIDEGGSLFTEQILGDGPELDVDQARAEHIQAATGMVQDHPEIGAIVLECTNMPPYAADIAEATGLPVYDLTTLVGWAVAGVRRRRFSRSGPRRREAGPAGP